MTGITRFAVATWGMLGAALLLSACGGGSASSSASAAAPKTAAAAQGPAQVTLTGSEFSFSSKTVQLKAGQPVQLTIVNGGRVDHDFKSDLPLQNLTYQQADNDKAEQQENAANGELDVDYAVGHTSKVTFVPTKPGTYQFYCDVPGHREAGMSGTFVVVP